MENEQELEALESGTVRTDLDLASEENPLQPDYRSQEEELNAGTGRHLTPEESAEKTKDWPKDDGKTMEEVNAEAQKAGMNESNLPPGVTQEDLDNR